LNTLERTYSISIDALRDLLGREVLLLSWPLGSKGTQRKWGHLTIEMMDDPLYLKKLATGNVGVALGEKSNGLCTIDIDRDDLVEPFLSANPHLSGTLQSHGARGRVFWIRCIGDYPGGTKILKTGAGEEVGEFRSTGGQSIIAGLHPDTGEPYQFVFSQPPLAVEYSLVCWDGVCVPPDCSQKSNKQKNKHKSLQSLNNSKTLLIKSQHSVKCKILTEKDIVVRCLPTKIHANHNWLFQLARGVRALERERGTEYGDADLKRLFDLWHGQASPFLRPGQTCEEYFEEFLIACDCAERPLDENAVTTAWERVESAPLPQAASDFKSPAGKLLISLCWQLQLLAGESEFYLSCYKAAPLLKVTPQQTAALLKQAVRKQILRVVEVWRTNRATRYRFNSEKSKTMML